MTRAEKTAAARRPERNLDLAVNQVMRIIKRQLGEMAPDEAVAFAPLASAPLASLTDGNLRNCARHIVQAIDVLGLEEDNG